MMWKNWKLYIFNVDYRNARHLALKRSDAVFAENGQKAILKVAVIGAPNAGKSTLINQIVGRNVLAVSRKVHTTRCCARAILMNDNTQVVFLDTPGLVGLNDSEKHHLEKSFLTDSEEAVKEADLVGVIHDVSNKFTRDRLSSKVLRLLHLHPEKPSFLIMNKVDIMKRKRDLLELADRLTSHQQHPVPSDVVEGKSLTQSQFQRMISKETGWPYFRDIFMVSALKGDGVGDIKIHLLNSAKPGPWLFERNVITDQSELSVVEKVVSSKLLEFLPNVVPYTLRVVVEYFNRSQDGSVTAVVLIGCKNLRTEKFIMGKGGGRMKSIAVEAEQDLRKFFLNDVRIKLVLVNEDKLIEDRNSKNSHYD